MVHIHRYHQFKKDEKEGGEDTQTLVLEFGNSGYYKKTKPKIIPLFFLFFLVCCSLLLLPQLFKPISTFSLLYSFGVEDETLTLDKEAYAPYCSSISNGTICCDRSSIRSDICFMRGDVRTRSASSSIFMYTSENLNFNGVAGYASNPSENGKENEEEEDLQHEKIRPYTRKWEASIMDTIEELNLIVKKDDFQSHHLCDVHHSVPAIFFSTGGYTGNVYHEFNDGLIPLYITSQHLMKEVVFVLLDFHDWWITKYGDILSRLSNYPPIDFNRDQRVHCFPEAIVGLQIHDELTVDSSHMQGNKSIVDFRNLLDKAYWPRIRGLIQDEKKEAHLKLKERLLVSPPSPLLLVGKEEEKEERWKKPKLVILSRNGSRAIINEDEVVELAEEIGFKVEVLRPDKTTELAKIYRVMNSSDIMVGVHGAAMTHFLFMKPGSMFIQVIPLGTDWAAQTYYGEPAMKLGLKYVGYKILPTESSLYKEYSKDDPVLRDPKSVNARGWQFTKKVYLDGQNLRLNLSRFRKRLVRAYAYSMYKRSQIHRRQQL